jgi:hypothetical protein
MMEWTDCAEKQSVTVLYQTPCRPLSKRTQANNVAFPPSFGGRRVSQRTTPIYAIPFFCGRIACVVSQVPTISGYQQGLRRIAPEGVAALEAAPNDDERAQACGEPPRRQAIVNVDGAIPASRRRSPTACRHLYRPTEKLDRGWAPIRL